MPCHHTLEGHVVEYMDRAHLAQVFKHRPLRTWAGGTERGTVRPHQRLEDGATPGQGGRHHHGSVQSHLPRHQDYSLPQNRGHAGEGLSDGGACFDPHHPALRSEEDRITLDEVVKINNRGVAGYNDSNLSPTCERAIAIS